MRKNVFTLIILFAANSICASAEISASFHTVTDRASEIRTTWLESLFTCSQSDWFKFSFYSYTDIESAYRSEKACVSASSNRAFTFTSGDFFLNFGTQSSLGNLDAGSPSISSWLRVQPLTVHEDHSESSKNFRGAALAFPLIQNRCLYARAVTVYSNNIIYVEKTDGNRVLNELHDIIFCRKPDADKQDALTVHTFIQSGEIKILNSLELAFIYTSLHITGNGRTFKWINDSDPSAFRNFYENISFLFTYRSDYLLLFQEVAFSENNFDRNKTIFCGGFRFRAKQINTELIIKEKTEKYFSPFSKEPGTDTDIRYISLLNDLGLHANLRFITEETIEKKLYSDFTRKYTASAAQEIKLELEKCDFRMRSVQKNESETAFRNCDNIVSAGMKPTAAISFRGTAGNRNLSEIADYYEISSSFSSHEKFSISASFFEKKTVSPYYRLSSEISYSPNNAVNLTLSSSLYFKGNQNDSRNMAFSVKSVF